MQIYWWYDGDIDGYDGNRGFAFWWFNMAIKKNTHESSWFTHECHALILPSSRLFM